MTAGGGQARTRLAIGLAGIACALLGCTAASAQVSALPGTNEVLGRSRPSYDAIGLPAGGFRLYPRLDVDLSFDDNIYSSDTVVVSDRYLAISPELALRSNWSRHSLALVANARVERYDRRTSENNERYSAGANGRFDVSPTISIDGSANYLRATEPRGSLGDILIGGRPIVYHSTDGRIGTSIELGHLTLRGGGGLSETRYGDARIGSTVLSQSYRDRNALTVSGEAGLIVSPSVTLYGSGSYNRQRYVTRQAELALDAQGFTALVGAGFEISRLISARASIGYQRQTFQNPAFATISGLTYDGALSWNPTALLSVSLTARRQIQQSPFLQISGILTDSVGVAVDYELLRNLLVNVALDYATDDYRGISRVDRRFEQRVSARYLLNRHLSLGVSYAHRHQGFNTLFGRRYEGNAGFLSLRIQT